MCDLDEPSASDNEVIRGGNNECHETAGSCLFVKTVMQQKVKHEQPLTQDGHPQGAPPQYIDQVPSLTQVNLGKNFWQKQGGPLAVWLL